MEAQRKQVKIQFDALADEALRESGSSLTNLLETAKPTPLPQQVLDLIREFRKTV